MKYSTYIVLLCSFLFIACGEDVVVQSDSIEGFWTVKEAKRNRKVTSTLDKSFFEFSEGNLKHNINGDTILTKYQLEGNKITVENDIIKSLDIKSIGADSLVLHTKISDFKFEFLLKKDNE